ncbi:tetratricopeptide repeat protein [Geitlerinema sp. P-1104]|uniref:tetratricopeptide repeat protein n=1 Tax=Geitlerinema sp. P-1104 TaxID=2546230 RepID=UPI001981BC66|nr:tetratricopeptide repeat protein [Geitlerinema sp. P-1104]
MADLEAGEALAGEAIAALEQGNFDQAETLWSQLIEQFPTNPALWSNRGNTRLG